MRDAEHARPAGNWFQRRMGLEGGGGSLEGMMALSGAETIGIAFVTSVLTTVGAYLLARHRLTHELRLQFRTEALLRKLLQHRKWEMRSFDAIKHHVGGFEDDDLRQHLVRAGAVRFYRGDVELWGLLERTSQGLEATDYKPLLVDRD
jgi:hypothetical protein